MREVGSLFFCYFFNIKRGRHFILFSDKTINTKYRLLPIITFELYTCMKESVY